MTAIYWEVRKAGNQHLAEAWRRCTDENGAHIHYPLHELVAGYLFEIRGDLRAKGFMPCHHQPGGPDVLEVWCKHLSDAANQSPD
jgi:hypothetical protein